jgi:hypothetical protein
MREPKCRPNAPARKIARSHWPDEDCFRGDDARLGLSGKYERRSEACLAAKSPAGASEAALGRLKSRKNFYLWDLLYENILFVVVMGEEISFF